MQRLSGVFISLCRGYDRGQHHDVQSSHCKEKDHGHNDDSSYPNPQFFL